MAPRPEGLVNAAPPTRGGTETASPSKTQPSLLPPPDRPLSGGPPSLRRGPGCAPRQLVWMGLTPAGATHGGEHGQPAPRQKGTSGVHVVGGDGLQSLSDSVDAPLFGDGERYLGNQQTQFGVNT